MSDNEKLREIHQRLRTKAEWRKAFSILALIASSAILTIALIWTTAYLIDSDKAVYWGITFEHMAYTWSPLLLIFTCILLALFSIKSYIHQER
ncbi:hypothetical protein [Vibrio paucivorans]|uniref:Uncharacterized protein n=1 Tax=Vibrio paucivorans TaxID=2829489 RepID=A0A9X3CFC3_9VIBR|nr:hypothetical protein [Vibrio paucivorans]MCW8334817.1 hypothetical protein [Vibrio paucivorans]